MKIYQTLCAQDPYLYANNTDRLIAVFDDQEYDRSDVDMLHPAQRVYVSNFLQRHGHKVRTGKTLQHIETGQVVFLSPTPSLGVNPLIELNRWWNETSVFVVTPTTFAMHLLATQGPLAKEKIKALVEVCPINVHKVTDLLTASTQARHWGAMVGEINLYQEAAIASQPRTRKPL